MDGQPRSHLGLRIFHILLLWIHLGFIVSIILLGAFSIITVGFITECVLAFFALVWVIPAFICSIWDNDSAWSQIGLDITYFVLQLAAQLFVAIWITLTRVSTDCYGYYSYYSSRYWREQDYEEAVCSRLVAAFVISYLHVGALFFAMIALIVLARRRINAGWGREVWKMSTARLLKIKGVSPPATLQGQGQQQQYGHLPPPPGPGFYAAPQQQQQYSGYYQPAALASPPQTAYTPDHNRSSTMSMPMPMPPAPTSSESTAEEIKDVDRDQSHRPLPALPQSQ